MSAPVILSLFTLLLPSILSPFATKLINSITQEHKYLAPFHYMIIIIILKLSFWHKIDKNVNILPYKVDIVMGVLSLYYQNMQLTSRLLILIQRIITLCYGMSRDIKLIYREY